MQFDAYAASVPVEHAARVAREVEARGFSGLWFTETQRPPYLGCAVAAEVTDTITIGTAIAVAFPRSPMVTAQTAWELARASRGRFSLGLGTQVKAHIERRFSMTYEHPGPKIRDYALALRAIFRAFQPETGQPEPGGQEAGRRGERLRYEGEFYRFSLLPDFFSPGPSDFPDIPISVAGVNLGMARLAGEVFDGFHVHPFHSRRYLDECLRPAIAEGAARAGRTAADVEVICPVFTIVGDTEAERAPMRESVRRQLSFYGSTRTYRPVFELHGWGDTSAALHRLMAVGDTDAMAATITDEMLDEYAVTAAWDDLADRLVERYRGVADRLFTYQPASEWLREPELAERWQGVAARVNAS
jgi:probable F420-dependent oxidoreductase